MSKLIVAGNKSVAYHYSVKDGYVICSKRRFSLEDGIIFQETNLTAVTCAECVEVIMQYATEILVNGVNN